MKAAILRFYTSTSVLRSFTFLKSIFSASEVAFKPLKSADLVLFERSEALSPELSDDRKEKSQFDYLARKLLELL